MKKGKLRYYPMHMHLHASHEPSASIGSHMSHAAKLGIFHLWHTEHDTRMGQKGRIQAYSFAFQGEELYRESQRAGFSLDEENNGTYAFENINGTLALRVQANVGEKESMFFHSKGKQHCDALFSRLNIELNADMVCPNTQSTVIVEFVLSAQPPSYQQAKMRYYLGKKPQKMDDAPVQYLPMPKAENGKYMFPITRDVEQEIGGLDNAFCNLRLWVENGGEMVFHSFTVHRELNFEQVRQEQIKVARELGKKWGVTPFVTFEITGSGHHKNCYSTKVPVIDYIANDFHVNNLQAIEHVKRHGGIFSWNHPFTETSGKGLPAEARDAIVDNVAKTLIENYVYGATLMEVGFPVGRDGFSMAHYLRLWDELGKSGICITGDGDSDCHHAVDVGWTTGNNFCTYAGIFENELPCEESFISAFKRGSVWFGNPVLMGKLTLECKHANMGGVVVGKRVLVRFTASDIRSDGYARCVVNGKEVKRIAIEKGKAQGAFWLANKQKYNFARVELYSSNDVPMAATNPIYLVENADDIPFKAIENGRYQQ